MAKRPVAFQDITGHVFGRLTVVRRADPDRPERWLCACSCGGEKIVWRHELLTNHTRSCGQCSIRKRHGLTKTYLHNTWVSIVQRCANPKARDFERYGGRGISLYPEWRDSFEAFAAYVGDRPSPDYSIDRIDNEKGYVPGNVHWATDIEQNNNSRNNFIVTYRGQQMTLAQAVRSAGSLVSQRRAQQRIRRGGWSVERAVETRPLK